MSQHNPPPEDSLERMMEQGAGGQSTANKMLQNTQSTPKPKGSSSNPFQAVATLVDPDAWVRQLYGIPEPTGGGGKSEQEQKKDKGNHTPLDKNKVGSKEITPEHRQFFKKYQEEYEQFLEQKKKEEQDKKRQEEEAEQKKKEEEKKKQEEQGSDQEAHGKQKQKLGQPRRKATTEQHPETKAGGAK